ncbi:MAG: YggS family pyridoxal phosphate-dependent enzyme [Casimicrobiaceae bacterium]|nr:YggS family pyridoxal phosphate-dependent enzyme [Casimicrobiaceae bacterium]MCX8098792.1 YggS family pyridoxal phosphate-dependent enzyme [Casimicrobiaceae bacterium]MDW8313272.1 YggS family pyridoxal phosphate-dependent enzyme [Burkholderiales bacterium]
MVDLESIALRLAAVRSRIDAAARLAGRAPESVRLLAVSKQHSAERIRAAYRAGQLAFGENYVQEALAKQAALSDLHIEWHLIGPLQSNKTRLAAEHFAWIHSLDRLSIAERLARQRPASLPPLNVCVQINVSGEASKSGVSVEEAPQLIAAVANLPRLALRGLMTIPAPGRDPEALRTQFARVAELFDTIRNGHPGLRDWDTLSMGMSDDLEIAIACGSTLVRVGTAIFGPRR